MEIEKMSRTTNFGHAVMDVSPWPAGRGFTGADAWWDYVLSKDEQSRLENLLGMALLNGDVRERLLHTQDHSLLAAFGLSQETQAWLCSVKASSLAELAQAIVSQRQRTSLEAA